MESCSKEEVSNFVLTAVTSWALHEEPMNRSCYLLFLLLLHRVFFNEELPYLHEQMQK